MLSFSKWFFPSWTEVVGAFFHPLSSLSVCVWVRARAMASNAHAQRGAQQPPPPPQNNNNNNNNSPQDIPNIVTEWLSFLQV